MPGILVMNQNSADGAPARDGLPRATGERPPVSAARSDKPALNGGLAAYNTLNHDSSSDPRNGAVANGLVRYPNLDSSPDRALIAPLDLPPEVRMQIQEELFSFPKMIQRAAQQCYSGLAGLLADMAALPTGSEPAAPYANGMGGRLVVNGGRKSEDDDLAKNKKVRMLKFTDSQQSVFAKLLIMAQWTPHMTEVGRLLDVDKWLRMREIDYNYARGSLLDLSRQGRFYREPNPDIRTALEVLSTRKAPWMPDFDFIPQDPLAPQEILKHLRDMNTILSIRINLHEELPRHLRNWSVKSGRAIFTIPGEFQLDVSTIDDNPSSPLYFIDLRFLFSPAPEIPDGRFRTELLEPQLNTILAESGLSACYDYLHNFCLTHKLLALRKQAIQMSQDNWAGTLRVDLVHRVLVVSYWTGTPGAKSWIEIGMSSGKSKKRSWRGSEPSFLSVRWMRNSREVTDRKIEFDWTNLDMERSLEKVLSLHMEHLFTSIHRHLQDMGSVDSTLASTLHLTPGDPSACRLDISLGRPSNRVQVTIDPLTGRFVLRPPGLAATQHEKEMNTLRNPAQEAHRLIARLLCLNLKGQIEHQVDQFGWEPVRNVPLRAEEFKKALGADILTSSWFRGQGWTSNWLLALTINLTGESWWLIEFKDNSQLSGSSISSVHKIPTERFWNKAEPVSQLFLQRLEQQVICDIGSFVTQRELKKRRIAHHRTVEATSTMPLDVVCVQTADLLKAALPGIKLSAAWAAPTMRLYFNKFSVRDGKLVHLIRGKTKQPDEANLGVIKTSPKDGVHFDPDGGSFTILLCAKFGEPCLSDLLFRLRSITRLRRFAAVLKAAKLPRPPRYSLSQLTFIYAKPDLTATVCFPEDSSVSLRFQPNSPHQRIRRHLNNMLSTDPLSGFRNVVEHLIITLPLLRALNSIEQPTLEPPYNALFPPSVHTRDVTWYHIVYNAPNPVCSFDLRLQWRRDQPVWHISDTKFLSQDERPIAERNHQRAADLDEALTTLYEERDTGWYGIRTGIVAGITTIEQALKRLDEVVRGCRQEDSLRNLDDVFTVEAITKSASSGTTTKTSNELPPQSQRPAPSSSQTQPSSQQVQQQQQKVQKLQQPPQQQQTQPHPQQRPMGQQRPMPGQPGRPLQQQHQLQLQHQQQKQRVQQQQNNVIVLD